MFKFIKARWAMSEKNKRREFGGKYDPLYDKVVRMSNEGYSYEQIAQACNISKMRVLDIIQTGSVSEIKNDVKPPIEEHKQISKEDKEALALYLLLNSLGSEDDMNAACDFIKKQELVEGYK